MDLAIPSPTSSAWYLVCASREVPPGGVRAVEDLEPQLLLYRTSSGELRAVSRSCPHLATDLVRAKVEGDQLVCPMHGWRFDGSGRCVGAPSHTSPQRSLPGASVFERYGAIFVSPRAGNATRPAFADIEDRALVATVCAPFDVVGCDWRVAAANGFDPHHFQTVHQRTFHSEPTLSAAGEDRMQIELHAGVTGTSLRDRFIKFASKNSVRIRIISHAGPLLTVESRVGRFSSHFLVSLYPVPGGTRVRSLYAIRRLGIPGLDWLRLQAAHRASLAFLRQDLGPLANMRFLPGLLTSEDTHLRRFFDWLPTGA